MTRKSNAPIQAKKQTGMRKKSKTPTLTEMETYSTRALKKFLKQVHASASLRKRASIRNRAGVMAPDFHVDFNICSAKRMQEINSAFRGMEEPTDVLSFPADPFFQQQGILGEIVLCAPVINAQAREFGHDWKQEIDVLLVHGILHLLHFDHELGERHAKDMHRWERKLLGPRNSKSLILRASGPSSDK